MNRCYNTNDPYFMSNDSLIINTYKRLSVDELIELASKPVHLRDEVVPLLVNELQARKLDDHATELLNAVQQLKTPGAIQDSTNFTSVNLEVEERMRNGESIESIKSDLQERGIDIFELLSQEKIENENFFEKLTVLKQAGSSDSELQQYVMEKEGMSEPDAQLKMDELKAKGRKNRLWGWIFVVTGVLLFLVALLAASMGMRPIFGVLPFVLLGLGITRIIKGNIQKRP
jgi:hypothetical protein